MVKRPSPPPSRELADDDASTWITRFGPVALADVRCSSCPAHMLLRAGQPGGQLLDLVQHDADLRQAARRSASRLLRSSRNLHQAGKFLHRFPGTRTGNGPGVIRGLQQPRDQLGLVYAGFVETTSASRAIRFPSCGQQAAVGTCHQPRLESLAAHCQQAASRYARSWPDKVKQFPADPCGEMWIPTCRFSIRETFEKPATAGLPGEILDCQPRM